MNILAVIMASGAVIVWLSILNAKTPGIKRETTSEFVHDIIAMNRQRTTTSSRSRSAGKLNVKR